MRRATRLCLAATFALGLSASASADDVSGHGVSATPIFVQKLPNVPG